MTKPLSASQQITNEVTSWPGVEAGPGKRGEFAFKVGSREIGHLHGDRAAHFSFPKDVWAELKEQGRITYHPVFPSSVGPASRRIITTTTFATSSRFFASTTTAWSLASACRSTREYAPSPSRDKS